MSTRVHRVLSLGVFLLLAMLMVPSAMAAGPTYSTSAISKTAVVQGTYGGYKGVLVNFTSTFSTTLGGFAYVDLTNGAGETVAWNLGYCSFSSGTTTQCFIAFPLSLTSGTFTANVFVTTVTGVAVSTTSSFQVTV